MKKFLALLLALLLILSLAACGKDKDADKQEETTDPVVEDVQETQDPETQDPETQDPEETTEPNEQPVDLSTFTFGVTEEGSDVVVSVKNTTEAGDVACVMTYKYVESALTEGLIQYYVPSGETAAALASQLESDPTVEAGTISVDGTCVSCKMASEQLQQLAQLSRQELIDAMKTAIADTQ